MHPLKRRGKSNDQLLSENEVMLLILIEIHFAFYKLKLFLIIILILSSLTPLFFSSFHLLLILFFISSSSLFHLLFLFSRPSSFFPLLFRLFPASTGIQLTVIFLINFSVLLFLLPPRSFYYHLFDVMRLQRYAFIGQMTLLTSKSSGNPADGAENRNQSGNTCRYRTGT